MWKGLEGTSEERVAPLPEYLWIWRAWHRLSSERHWPADGFSVHMGGTLLKGRPETIPWRAVLAWAEYHNLSKAEMALLDRCICAMDAVFIAHWSEKLKRSLGK